MARRNRNRRSAFGREDRTDLALRSAGSDRVAGARGDSRVARANRDRTGQGDIFSRSRQRSERMFNGPDIFSRSRQRSERMFGNIGQSSISNTGAQLPDRLAPKLQDRLAPKLPEILEPRLRNQNLEAQKRFSRFTKDFFESRKPRKDKS